MLFRSAEDLDAVAADAHVDGGEDVEVAVAVDVAEGRELGDTSTLADPTVVDDLVTNRQNKKGEKAAS